MALNATEVVAPSAATEHTHTPLAELVTDEVGAADTWDLRVFTSFIHDFSYQWQGKEVTSKKLLAILLSANPREYCLGVARPQRQNAPDLQTLLAKFAPGTTWKFSKVVLQKSEKPQYINTSVRISIDLRASHTTALLQSSQLPLAPEPATTVADVLQLKGQQRFDLMAVPLEVLGQRRTGAGQVVADVRLADGSMLPATAGSEASLATIPLPLFFKSDSEFESFSQHVGKTPLLFMCLNGNVTGGAVTVTTLKGQSFWKEAVGKRRNDMEGTVPQWLQSTPADIVSLPTFAGQDTADYAVCTATLTACSILDLTAASRELLEGDATEHVYQLNHVYVPAPAKTHTVTHDGRLFAIFDCWDFSKKVQLAFRSKAMCSLAGATADDYTAQLAQGELRHPLLASLRVRIKKGTGNREFAAIVVEAAPLDLAEDDIPNDSLDALHGLLAAGGPPATERMVAVHISDIAHSPFYNLTAGGVPVEKVLALLQFTQATKGAQQQGSFRLVADNVVDGCTGDASLKVATIARCSVDRCPDFSAQKGAFALVVLCKATAPNKEQHVADVYIEAMLVLERDHIQNAKNLIESLRSVAGATHTGAEPSQESAFQQRKCRRLHRYPTMS